MIDIRKNLENYEKTSKSDNDGKAFNDSIYKDREQLRILNPDSSFTSSNKNQYPSLFNIATDQHNNMDKAIVELYNAQDNQAMLTIFNNLANSQNKDNSKFVVELEKILNSKNIRYNYDSDTGNLTF